MQVCFEACGGGCLLNFNLTFPALSCCESVMLRRVTEVYCLQVDIGSLPIHWPY
jgi:hypothetical protein